MRACFLFAFLTCGTAAAAETPSDTVAKDVQILAAKIDQMIAKGWTEAKVEPAARANDSEFLRRVYLDVAGRIPSAAETRTFLKDSKPDKRERLVAQLLTGPVAVTHSANIWRALLLPEAATNFAIGFMQAGFEGWLKSQAERNAGYDQMVRDLITAPIVGNNVLASREATPIAFYFAKDFKPSNLASTTAQVFLGVSVGCAECHDHPFAEWKRDQFWEFASFFAGITEQQGGGEFRQPAPEDKNKRGLTIPGTTRTVQAKYLDGAAPVWKGDTRTTLADWVTSPNNPYFARAAVNRAWAYFLGTGFVEPLDEMVGASSKAVYPEVLDLLAKEFTEHRFDTQFLIRVITATRAYQLSSASTSKSPSQEDRALFARMPLRGMTAEQLFDSVVMATGFRESPNASSDPIQNRLGNNRPARTEFLTKFAASDRPTEAQTSILQALMLMNGKVMAQATALEQSETLASVANAPFLSMPERIETLYLAALSRPPSTKELDRTVQFVREAVKDKKDAALRTANGNALADVFWALLNSPEFMLNH